MKICDFCNNVANSDSIVCWWCKEYKGMRDLTYEEEQGIMHTEREIEDYFEEETKTS